MKFTEFKNEEIYLRNTDKKHFKKNGNTFFTLESGEWIESEDLKLTDQFTVVHGDPSIVSLEHMYRKYKQGTLEDRDRNFDRLLVQLCREVDKLKEQ